MFKCAVCKQTIGPGTKPIRVVESIRRVAYHNEYFVEDEWGNKEKREVDSFGTEITKEALLCPEDARASGIDVPEPKGTTTIVRGKHSFEEKPAPPLAAKLIAGTAHTALDRVNQKSKRAQADSMVAVPLIKWFVDHNKEYVF